MKSLIVSLRSHETPCQTAPQPVESTRSEQVDAAAPVVVDRSGNPEAASRLDWSTVAYELGLSGIAQELVANCELVSYADQCVRLQLAGELHELVNDLTRGEILAALQQKLGVSLRLEIAATDQLLEQTPLQARLLREQRERQAAIDAIQQDAVVRKLQQAFGVELDEASVVKIESNR